MKFNGVNHLAMATGDMDKTILFWRDLLGVRLVTGLGQPGYRHLALEGSEPQKNKWPKVKRATPIGERIVYPGAGSELFHGYRKGE